MSVPLQDVVTLQAFQSLHSFNTLLPAGSPLQVIIQVQDKFGATATVAIDIMVNQSDVSTPDAVAGYAQIALNGLAAAQQTGSLATAAQVLKFLR